MAALRDHRLVTATGPGGVGKTRLALAAAADVADDVPDGVVFVDLVKVTQPDAVVDAIATAADVPETSTTTREEALVAALGRRNCLLVVDNCEHVQDAARTLIERLLHDCPSLHVLATSRLRLMLPFEHVVSVPGLSLATPEGASDAEALFVERMTAAGAAPPQPAEVAAIAEICTALDGMALGIELAAARVPSLGVTPLAGALGSRLDLLDIGPRAEERHRSLRAAIDWSYALLDADERAVLRAASVFAAPPDLDAVSAVSGRSPGAVIAALGGLVDWNLVALESGSPDALPGAGDDPPVRRRGRRARRRDRGTARGPRRLVPTSPRRPVGTSAGGRAVVRRGGRRARRRPRRPGVGASAPGVT